MKLFELTVVQFVLILICSNLCLGKLICPKQCYCDVYNDLNRASCIDHKIVDIDVGVPKYVQIYNLSYNMISKIDDYAFMHAGFLLIEDLNLSYNTIFWIGLHAFANLKELKHLNLAYNRLQSLQHDLFWYNNKLTSLDVSGNKFLDLKNEPFLSHSKLTTINFSNSQISYIPPDMFNKLPNLKELDFSGNEMTKIDIAALMPLSKLHQINLNGNKWYCDMEFNKLQVWLHNNKVIYEPQCKLKSENIKMFERMEVLDTKSEESNNEKDLDELWSINDETTKSDDKILKSEVDDTFLMAYNERVPSTISLLIGFQMGIVFGILGTYCWLAKLYKCKRIQLPNRRHIRRLRRMENQEGSDALLWNSILQGNYATPPSMRRQISNIQQLQETALCNRLNENRVNDNITTQNTSVSTTSTFQDRVETPPPTYSSCWNDVILNTNSY